MGWHGPSGSCGCCENCSPIVPSLRLQDEDVTFLDFESVTFVQGPSDAFNPGFTQPDFITNRIVVTGDGTIKVAALPSRSAYAVFFRVRPQTSGNRLVFKIESHEIEIDFDNSTLRADGGPTKSFGSRLNSEEWVDLLVNVNPSRIMAQCQQEITPIAEPYWDPLFQVGSRLIGTVQALVVIEREVESVSKQWEISIEGGENSIRDIVYYPATKKFNSSGQLTTDCPQRFLRSPIFEFVQPVLSAFNPSISGADYADYPPSIFFPPPVNRRSRWFGNQNGISYPDSLNVSDYANIGSNVNIGVRTESGLTGMNFVSYRTSEADYGTSNWSSPVQGITPNLPRRLSLIEEIETQEPAPENPYPIPQQKLTVFWGSAPLVDIQSVSRDINLYDESADWSLSERGSFLTWSYP